MTFKKNDAKSKEAAIKGGLAGGPACQKMHPKVVKNLMQYSKSPEERRIIIEDAERKLVEKYPDIHSRAGKLSRKFENEVAKTLEGDVIFLPQEICDRIAIRNGKVYFIEIKHTGQKLRPKQEQFRNIVKEQYEIVYG